MKKQIWRVERIEGYIQVRSNNGCLIYERGEPRDTRTRSTLLKEARLAAAAPELLEALKLCSYELAQNESANEPGELMDKALKTALKSAHAAIDKAEGRKK